MENDVCTEPSNASCHLADVPEIAPPTLPTVRCVNYTQTLGAQDPRNAWEISVTEFIMSLTAVEGIQNGLDYEQLQSFPRERFLPLSSKQLIGTVFPES